MRRSVVTPPTTRDVGSQIPEYQIAVVAGRYKQAVLLLLLLRIALPPAHLLATTIGFRGGGGSPPVVAVVVVVVVVGRRCTPTEARKTHCRDGARVSAPLAPEPRHLDETVSLGPHKRHGPVPDAHGE